MHLIIKGRHDDLNDTLRTYAHKKISKVRRIYDNFTRIEVEFSAEKNPRIANGHSVEVTIFAKGAVIRAAEAGTDYMSAIDVVVKKLEKQVRKYKEKMQPKASKHGEPPREFAPVDNSAGTKSDQPMIVRTKRFGMKPMTPEEAALQMDLLGHSFFVFTNSNTDEINVIYRRKDDNYGLIEPTLGPG